MQGDISCQNKLTIAGVIEGNISACDIDLDNAILNGDLTCTGDLHLSETATIAGNCENIHLDVYSHFPVIPLLFVFQCLLRISFQPMQLFLQMLRILRQLRLL